METEDRRTDDPPPSLDEIWRLLAAAAAAAGARPRPIASGPVRPPEIDAEAPALVQFLAQASLAYMASGLRLWSRTADAWSRALPAMTHAVSHGLNAAGSDGEARAVLLDELRARLRELAEYPSLESKRLQEDLDRIAAEIWPAAKATSDGPYWRRWAAKP